jgi:hypothetical protein
VKATGASAAELKRQSDKHDRCTGRAAQALLDGSSAGSSGASGEGGVMRQQLLFSKPPMALTIRNTASGSSGTGVYEGLLRLATLHGSGSEGRKVNAIATMLRATRWVLQCGLH